MKRRKFHARDLRLVVPAPPADSPPLGVGDLCTLNSGGPSFLIVDVEADRVVVAWPHEGVTVERSIPRACVRRSR